jgi:hypothetical protein
VERRERELSEFMARRAKEGAAFESNQKKELERLRAELEGIGETYDAPGRRLKRGARFGWG